MAVKLGVEVGDRLVATLEGAVGFDGLAMVRGLILVATSARRRAHQHLQDNNLLQPAPNCLTCLQLTPLDIWLLWVTCI